MILQSQISRSRQGYIGLARCCYISLTEPDKFAIIFHTKICQYFTFNMWMSYIFVDVQVTDEGGWD